MNRLVKWAGLVLACALAVGCAHPITMAPNLDAVKNTDTTRIQKTVALHVADSARNLEVTTAGGGGDKVRYFPYKDLETGLYKALTEVFTNVTTVKNTSDKAELKSSGATLVFTPEISTFSFSDSVLTWPPTKFGVTLNCTISDAQGATVQTIRVTGDGFAPFEEFKSNFSLSAVRASNDALDKLVKALKESPDLAK